MSMRRPRLLAFIAAFAIIATTTPAPAKPETTSAGTASSGGLQAFCNLNFPGPPDYVKGQSTYFTEFFAMTSGNPAALFSQYVSKKYSIQHWSAPSCTQSSVGVSQLQPLLQQQIAKAKELGGTVVLTDWTQDKHAALMAELAKNPPPAASKPAPSTAPPAAAPVKSPTASSVAPAGNAFSYCYASGTPQGPGNGKPRKQHFYVTALFARAATDRPDGDWQKFIRGAHTDEAFNASCTAPGPQATAEKARLTQIADMRKLANFEVVDVDWKR